jgi:hypothetical protein
LVRPPPEPVGSRPAGLTIKSVWWWGDPMNIESKAEEVKDLFPSLDTFCFGEIATLNSLLAAIEFSFFSFFYFSSRITISFPALSYQILF